MMLRHTLVLLLLVPWLAAGCNISLPKALPTPTVEIEAIATATPPPSATHSPVPPRPSPTTAPVLVVTAEPTATAPQASPAPPPTATSPFFEYLVQEGETLFYIIQCRNTVIPTNRMWRGRSSP